MPSLIWWWFRNTSIYSRQFFGHRLSLEICVWGNHPKGEVNGFSTSLPITYNAPYLLWPAASPGCEEILPPKPDISHPLRNTELFIIMYFAY